MPSTYSPSLRLELQATGENANTWGTKTNNNLELIEQAVAGYVKITLTSASATYPLTIADASASDGRNAYIEFVGTVASAISITVPDVEKGYWVKNSATGSALTFRTSSGTGVVLPTNQWVNLVSDGASITSTFPTSIAGYALLSATQTFTGANTFTSAVNIQSATSLASTLVVGGAATFNSQVSVSGVMVVGAGAVATPSYSTTGDTNTGLYFPSADTIAATTGGNERMRIDSSGNIGIGTTSPVAGSRLAVVGGGIQLSGGTTSQEGVRIQRASGLCSFTGINNDNNAYNALTFATGASEAMRIDSSGKVGIGTSSPDYLLTLQTGDAAISMKDTGGTTRAYIGTAGILGSAPTGALRLRSDQGGIVFGYLGFETMRIDTAGNVVAGGSVALATTATNGFLYVPTCAGTPTGTPTAITGMAPIVVNTTNNKLFFYSGGAWRDAGP